MRRVFKRRVSLACPTAEYPRSMPNRRISTEYPNSAQRCPQIIPAAPTSEYPCCAQPNPKYSKGCMQCRHPSLQCSTSGYAQPPSITVENPSLTSHPTSPTAVMSAVCRLAQPFRATLLIHVPYCCPKQLMIPKKSVGMFEVDHLFRLR